MTKKNFYKKFDYIYHNVKILEYTITNRDRYRECKIVPLAIAIVL